MNRHKRINTLVRKKLATRFRKYLGLLYIDNSENKSYILIRTNIDFRIGLWESIPKNGEEAVRIWGKITYGEWNGFIYNRSNIVLYIY